MWLVARLLTSPGAVGDAAENRGAAMSEEETPHVAATPKGKRPRAKGTVAKATAPKMPAGLVVANIKDVAKRLKNRPGSKFK